MAKAAKKKLAPTLLTFYAVKDSDSPVTLEISFFSPGNSVVTTAVISNNTIVNEEAGDVPERDIDTNNSLDGRRLVITSNATRLQGGSALAEVTINIRGGVSAKKFPISANLDKEGKSAILAATIEFIKP